MLTTQTRTAYDDNRQVYGAPRIHAELTEAGVQVGRKRVARLMRQAEIVGCHRRKRPFSTTRQDPPRKWHQTGWTARSSGARRTSCGSPT